MDEYNYLVNMAGETGEHQQPDRQTDDREKITGLMWFRVAQDHEK